MANTELVTQNVNSQGLQKTGAGAVLFGNNNVGTDVNTMFSGSMYIAGGEVIVTNNGSLGNAAGGGFACVTAGSAAIHIEGSGLNIPEPIYLGSTTAAATGCASPVAIRDSGAPPSQ